MADILQITLMVEEAKELIAMAITNHPMVKKVMQRGKLVLKGGTTVSRISQLITNKPLSICGRITERGSVGGLYENKAPHILMIEDKSFKNIDDQFLDEVLKLGPKDLIICGANALDAYGNAAMMVGSPGGGDMSYAFSSWYGEGVPVLIPVGIEKMIPGDLRNVIKRTGRKRKKLSMGMGVGLIPIMGEIITEIEALKLMANVECQVIGAGGLGRAQGSVTIDIWGHDKELEKLMQVIKTIKERAREISGDSRSLIECKPPCMFCKEHLGCGYKSGKL